MMQKKSIILFSIVTNIRRRSFFEMVFTMELTLGHHFEQKSQKRLLGYLGTSWPGEGVGKGHNHIFQERQASRSVLQLSMELEPGLKKTDEQCSLQSCSVLCRAVQICAVQSCAESAELCCIKAKLRQPTCLANIQAVSMYKHGQFFFFRPKYQNTCGINTRFNLAKEQPRGR